MHGAFGPCGPVVEGPPRRGSSTKAQRPPRRRRSSTRPDAIGAGPCAGGETLGRCRNSGIIGMVCTLGIYTSCMTYDIHITAWDDISYHISIYLSIYPSIHPSILSIHPIHPSIHPPTYTHIHTVNIIAGGVVWWLVLFLHTVVSIWRYLWSFFLWGYSTIGILLYTTQSYGIMRLIKILHNHW